MTIRSEPFAWDGLTGAEGEQVSASIGGNELPFTSTATAPAFAGDLSGAQWTIAVKRAYDLGARKRDRWVGGLRRSWI